MTLTIHDFADQDLAGTLSTVARRLQAEPDEQRTLAGIVETAVATVPGAVYGGISQVRGASVTTQAPTSDLVRCCDRTQAELGQGPCLDAIRQQHTVIVDDMSTDSRWPHFARYATSLGVGSMISFQLYVQDNNLGALNLYGATGSRFDAEARTTGEMFASHAAIALSGAMSKRQMDQAVTSRDTIGQAKGILMERFALDADQAFSMLVHSSQGTNLKLVDVARWLIDDAVERSGHK